MILFRRNKNEQRFFIITKVIYQKLNLETCNIQFYFQFEKKLRDYKLEVNEQIMLMFENQSANIAKKIDEKFQILLKRLDNKIDEFKNQVSNKMS